jgi:fatty acid desaturase
MKSKLLKIFSRQEGQGGLIALVGLIAFVAGLLCLLIWGTDMSNRDGWLAPGIILAGGGFVLLSLGSKKGSG